MYNVVGSGTLTLTATGDVDGQAFEEWVDSFELDGGFIGRAGNGFGGTVVANTDPGLPGPWKLTQTFVLSESLIETIISDGFVDWLFKAAPSVGNGGSIGAELKYEAVPEPTSMALLGLGACGALGMVIRRRFAKA